MSIIEIKVRLIQMYDNLRDILTTKDLVEILPIGKNYIYRLLDQNIIKNIRVGSKFLIPKQSLIDFLNTSDSTIPYKENNVNERQSTNQE